MNKKWNERLTEIDLRARDGHPLQIKGDPYTCRPCIYHIVNVTNGKKYIGQTSIGIWERRSKHESHLMIGDHHCAHLQSAWNKSGSKSFYIEVQYYCPIENVAQEEINEYNRIDPVLRYNTGLPGVNPTLGLTKTRDHRLRLSRAGGGRPVIGISPEGDERWFEMSADTKEFGFSPDKVRECCAGNRKSHHKWIWKYDPSYKETEQREEKAVKLEKRSREIIGTGPNGEERRYPSVSSVKSDGFAPSNVSSCLAKPTKCHKGYSWRYADGLPHRTMTTEQKEKLVGKHRTGRAIYGIHKDSGVRIDFDYVSQAEKALNITTGISQCLRGKIPTAGGYSWHYADGLPHKEMGEEHKKNWLKSRHKKNLD